MTEPNKETDARILIDLLLRDAGWDPADKSQVRTEVAAVSATPDEVSSLVQEAPVAYSSGRCDYVLADSNSRPLAVIEAKRGKIDPYTAKQQALPYAKRIGAPFIFLSNGELIYFWDYQNDDARAVSSFFSRRDLERLVWLRTESQPLATIPIPDYYIREGETRHVRVYQQDCMRAIDHAVELGKRRFLIELPTGMGKTDLICLAMKRLMQAGRAERVLFLVDREQLAKQVISAIQDICSDRSSYWLQAGMERQEQQITVCLLQTMTSRYREFTSGYFDLVIMDEAHRSIYGSWQAALTHFDAFHVGLTATPAAYIERNTFTFYHCKDEQPDFSYPIQDAFREGFLIPYKFATGITCLIADGTEVDGQQYDPAEFERKWTNEDSNRKMMVEFDRIARESFQELAPGQKEPPGKSIVFAITKHHAARLARYLNELHPDAGGRYAEVITSDIADADAAIRRFKKETYPQVAVSVDMLTTGFDCPDVLHLVLARRVFSPTLYQQIRGRGTRRCDRIGKKRFVIYDFFRNHEYFSDSETDPFEGSASGGGGVPSPKGPGSGELIELGLTDEWLEAVSYVEVGPDGERVDKKEYVTEWEKSVRSASTDDGILQKVKSGESLTAEQEEELSRRLNQPRHYFNEDNLRRAYRRPGGNLIDFVKAALGTTKLKTREEETSENFQAWLITKNFSPQQASYLSLLKNRGVVRGKVDVGDLFQPPLSILDAANLGIELFGEAGLSAVIEDLNQSVFPARTA
ncbi:MAG: DEAD/DEAH box helicase family protein [Terrimicrobiaceae bacterium]|nr:DEAD/DEAH box helicase family protein [Terrimicrobiaceae bacterium]